MEIIFILLFFVVLAILVILLMRKPGGEIKSELREIEKLLMKVDAALERNERSLKDEFQRNRKESNEISQGNREELSRALSAFSEQFTRNTKDLNELLRQKFSDFSVQQSEQNRQTTQNVKEVRDAIENQLKSIREDNTRQLDEMRKTVDEKLQKTLNERLSQSFETVGKQLQEVQAGLGEMRNLASDVGGLKKVLSNVKRSGGIGEIQLSMLLEQILAPEQYEANVKTKVGSAELVEFAIKLPGRDDAGTTVWLPIDAKFPRETYEQLLEAYEEGEPEKVAAAQKALDVTVKKMARDISEKYVDPPNTTDFAIMFLPFEGIYAEVVRKASLLEDLQRNYKVIVTGPTTLAAILNSLQMGFKTLAIQKRSGEVWKVLGAVKKEFENFEGIMNKAQKSIQSGLDHMDTLIGKRTRAIYRSLKNVEALTEDEKEKILPELMNSGTLEEDDD